MPRRSRTTAARRTVVEEVTVTETIEDTLPGVAFAPGWLDMLPDEAPAEQRWQQVDRCLDLLWLEVTSEDEPSPSAIGAAATVLRAGPGASPKELLLGGRRL